MAIVLYISKDKKSAVIIRKSFNNNREISQSVVNLPC